MSRTTKPFTENPPESIFAAFTDDRMYHVSTRREWAEEAASEMPDGKPFKVFAYTLDSSPDRRVEEIRKLCEHHKDTGYGAKLLSRCILKLLTPTAKGGRR